MCKRQALDLKSKNSQLANIIKEKIEEIEELKSKFKNSIGQFKEDDETNMNLSNDKKRVKDS